MRKRYLVVVFVLILASLAGCGGGEEPTPTPTPLATFTPTAAPIEAATATPAPSDTDSTDVTATPAADDVFVPELIAPESPLVAPDSPLPPPAAEAAPVVEPAPTPAPISGAWQLQTIRSSSSMSETTAPEGYRLAFSRTGVVRAIADCKTGRGEFTRLPDGSLTMDVTLRDTRCAPNSLADPFAQALSEVTSYRFDGDRLVLNYGTQGGEMGLARSGQMAAFGAPFLSWNNLKNSTFLVPGMPAGDGQAPLVDGEFRARTAPPAAASATVTDTVAAVTDTAKAEATTVADFVVSLATMHTYGDLDPETPEPTPTTSAGQPTPTPTPTPEVSIDSIVVLVVDDTAPAPKSYLAPVLNGGGLAIPLTLELLGENVYVRDLRWDGQQLTIDFDQGTEGKRRVYNFNSDHFVQVNEEGLAVQQAKGRLDLPTQDVVLASSAETGAGVPSASLTGAIDAGIVHPYRLPAQARQQLTVTLQSPYDDVWLSLYGAGDRTVLRSIRAETNTWSGVVPSGQDYIISAVASGSASPYTLTIELAGEGHPAVEPQLPVTTTAATSDTVHLVIDGVPQPAILDVLQRNNAQTDFFVTSEQAAQDGAELATGVADHGIGIVAGPISALTSDGRDALFAEIGAARQNLGGEAGKCLRPPYAATDGYTRAAANELGFDIVLWDIDAGTTTADALAAQVFPGAVIRFEDSGDGGRAVGNTLETLLPLLAEQGYTVQAQCK